MGFALLAGLGALLLSAPRCLAWVGRMVQEARKRPPLDGLPERLEAERRRILDTVGPRWKLALAVAVARWLFDYGTLLVALAAIGSHPRPGLVLLAFCGAKALGQIPITPGGLGFMEAGLSAMLVLAGVDPGDALVATFAYRLFSYWLPLPFGLLGLALAPRTPLQIQPART